ncbi:hypothetical protein ABUE34_12940 [Kozakia baliensis]|uniref:hypothetical protein n=1 Tax=Kozakia baliensis TaxID=153496 RepID=UPI00345BE83B
MKHTFEIGDLIACDFPKVDGVKAGRFYRVSHVGMDGHALAFRNDLGNQTALIGPDVEAWGCRHLTMVATGERVLEIG